MVTDNYQGNSFSLCLGNLSNCYWKAFFFPSVFLWQRQEQWLKWEDEGTRILCTIYIFSTCIVFIPTQPQLPRRRYRDDGKGEIPSWGNLWI